MNGAEIFNLACKLGFYVAPAGNGFWDSRDQFMQFANACCDMQREKDAEICDKQAYRNGIAKDCAWAIRANKGE